MPCPSLIDLSYSAGLIDGEGSITLSKETCWRKPVVSMSSTTLDLLVFLKSLYGGNISVQKRYKAHHKLAWSWKLSGRRAISMLELILPYMREPSKIERARMIVERYDLVTCRNGKYSPEQFLLKRSFEDEFFVTR